MLRPRGLSLLLWALGVFIAAESHDFATGGKGVSDHHHNHHHHRHKHHKHHKHHQKHNASGVHNVTRKKRKGGTPALAPPQASPVMAAAAKVQLPKNLTMGNSSKASLDAEEQIMIKMKGIEDKLASHLPSERAQGHLLSDQGAHDMAVKQGNLIVNGPVPTDFAFTFSEAAAEATGTPATMVHVIRTKAASESGVDGDVSEIIFEAPGGVVDALEDQAANPESALAKGRLHSFLVAKDGVEVDVQGQYQEPPSVEQDMMTGNTVHSVYMDPMAERTGVDSYGNPCQPQVPPLGANDPCAVPQAPPQPPQPNPDMGAEPCDDGIDVDTSMPYGDLEPFGREDTAQELTESSIRESDEMVDQLERAEVAEEKRSVFRALTRLRGAAITSFDGVARSQTGNIDQYAKTYKWRMSHPVHHLADEESDITKWAFPDNADF